MHPLFVAFADRIRVVDGVRFHDRDQLLIGNVTANETSNYCSSCYSNWSGNWNVSSYDSVHCGYDYEWKRAILRVARSVFRGLH